MSQLNSASIHCLSCECVRTYTGRTEVGNEICEVCPHPLRYEHHVDGQTGYANPSGSMPNDFKIGAQFE